MSRLPRAITIGLAVVALVVAGCANDDDEGGEARASSNEPVVVGDDTVTATSDAPRASGFTPAREDISSLECTQAGSTWEIAGTVENPTDAPADYRIYTLLLDGKDALQGIAQADVVAVGAGETQDWTASIDLGLDDLHCGVRVERTPSG